MDLAAGVYQIKKCRVVHRGRPIELDSLELEITSSQAEDISVFASAVMRAKVPGLGPDEKDIQVMLEWEGKSYQIAEATVFDVDLHPSGATSLQITGKLQLMSGKVLEDL